MSEVELEHRLLEDKGLRLAATTPRLQCDVNGHSRADTLFVSFRFAFCFKITFAVKTDDAHLKALLVAYFKRFGSKPVCYYDIGR